MRFRTLFDATPAEAFASEAIARDLASARLSPAFKAYYRVRPLVPIALRQLLQRRRGGAIDAGPDWFIPRAFLEGLEGLLPGGPDAIDPPWPGTNRTALVLTHDVETADGLRRVPELAALEERLGLRSCWNLVPHKYPIDDGLVRDLLARGFEVGVHGYNHDGRLFWSRRVFHRRAPAIARAAERFESVGFRAPMVHRNLEWIAGLPFEYDASCFDIDPYQAMPGGVGHVWPFLADGLVELPYTMPQDHTLFVALGERDDTVWRRKLEVVERWSGMTLLLTHPDYLDTPALRGVYQGFLEHCLARGGAWHALPRDVARWWRRRPAPTDPTAAPPAPAPPNR